MRVARRDAIKSSSAAAAGSLLRLQPRTIDTGVSAAPDVPNRVARIRLALCLLACLFGTGTVAVAQTTEDGLRAATAGLFDPDAAPAAAAADPAPTNPWSDRPVCASMFLKADFQLGPKQRVCDWISNGVFSTTAMLGAAWSAGFSQRIDRTSERGDGFATRFGRKFAQNAFKASGAYVGTLIAREDPRRRPPFLAFRTEPPPRGFFNRVGHALAGNLTSFRCTGDCSTARDVKKTPALSRVLGSVASGFAGELLTWDRPRSTRRAWNGAASAYASTFVDALFVEFKPELSAIAGTVFSHLFGGR